MGSSSVAIVSGFAWALVLFSLYSLNTTTTNNNVSGDNNMDKSWMFLSLSTGSSEPTASLSPVTWLLLLGAACQMLDWVIDHYSSFNTRKLLTPFCYERLDYFLNIHEKCQSLNEESNSITPELASECHGDEDSPAPTTTTTTKVVRLADVLQEGWSSLNPTETEHGAQEQNGDNASILSSEGYRSRVQALIDAYEAYKLKIGIQQPEPGATTGQADIVEGYTEALQKQRQSTSEDDDHRRYAVENEDDDSLPLPECWIQAVDDKTLKVYFYNTLTQETSWERPTEKRALDQGLAINDMDQEAAALGDLDGILDELLDDEGELSPPTTTGDHLDEPKEEPANSSSSSHSPQPIDTNSKEIMEQEKDDIHSEISSLSEHSSRSSSASPLLPTRPNSSGAPLFETERRAMLRQKIKSIQTTVKEPSPHRIPSLRSKYEGITPKKIADSSAKKSIPTSSQTPLPRVATLYKSMSRETPSPKKYEFRSPSKKKPKEAAGSTPAAEHQKVYPDLAPTFLTDQRAAERAVREKEIRKDGSQPSPHRIPSLRFHFYALEPQEKPEEESRPMLPSKPLPRVATLSSPPKKEQQMDERHVELPSPVSRVELSEDPIETKKANAPKEGEPPAKSGHYSTVSSLSGSVSTLSEDEEKKVDGHPKVYGDLAPVLQTDARATHPRKRRSSPSTPHIIPSTRYQFFGVARPDENGDTPKQSATPKSTATKGSLFPQVSDMTPNMSPPKQIRIENKDIEALTSRELFPPETPAKKDTQPNPAVVADDAKSYKSKASINTTRSNRTLPLSPEAIQQKKRRDETRRQKEEAVPCPAKYNSKMHNQKGPCSRCWMTASKDEQDKYNEKGYHIRIIQTKGGCEAGDQCTVICGREGIGTVGGNRVCRTCFNDTHTTFGEMDIYRGNHHKMMK